MPPSSGVEAVEAPATAPADPAASSPEPSPGLPAATTWPSSARRPPALRLLATPPLLIADVALFYGERSGGIRTYLEAKADYAARTGEFEHHLIVPGRAGRSDGRRHEVPSVLVNAANGYRIPLGGRELHPTLLALRPDVVIVHDAFWAPRGTVRAAHRAGAAVVAVHHASVALHAAGLPAPKRLVEPVLRRWYRRAYSEVDAIMSVVDPLADCGRHAALPLRLGLDLVFRPRWTTGPRGPHVLYAGRLAPEKGLSELLEAAAMSSEPWPLVLQGAGPAEAGLRKRARRLGLGDRVRFAPFEGDRERLARTYAEAACVVLPGAHETFGLVALEAAACGARVVTSRATPSSRALGHLVDTFRGGEAEDLLCAIERARRRPRDFAAAGELAARHSWERAIAAEIDDLRELLCG
jgi:alpha-1,6-mannosyltransferase